MANESSASKTSAECTSAAGELCRTTVQAVRVRRTSSSSVRKMTATYMPHLKKDPALEALLAVLGQKYFKIRQAGVGGLGRMMSSIIRGLMVGAGS